MSDKKTALVVDDKDVVRNMLVRFTERAGYEVREASGGADGIEALRDYRPDLVITDYEMPGMDGYEFSKVLRSPEMGYRGRIVVASGRLQKLHEDHPDVNLYADAFLQKPFLLADFMKAISPPE